MLIGFKGILKGSLWAMGFLVGYENEFGGSLRGFPSSSILSLLHGAIDGLPLMFRDSGSHFQGEAVKQSWGQGSLSTLWLE